MGVRIQQFFDNATPGDSLLFYYSGHGDSNDLGDLVLTHRESDRNYPDTTTEKFADVYQWARKSRARSICIILDCCKAGSGVKGAPPEFDTSDDRPARSLLMLFAVPDSRSARASDGPEGLSPFTAMLCNAIAETAVADDDGLVRFDSVTAAVVEEARQTGQARPRPFGDRTANPVLARRPEAIYLALERAGLSRCALEYTGGAEYDGKLLHIRIDRTKQLSQRISAGHPRSEIIGGPTGTGKTWMLCDVSEQLSSEGWHTVALRATIDEPNPSDVNAALRGLARVLRDAPRPSLLLIDGIESSAGWIEVVNGLDGLESEGLSVLAAVEVQRAPVAGEFEGITVGTVASIGGAGSLGSFHDALFEPGTISALGDLTAEERMGAAQQLRQLVGSDLWAAVHLAPISVEPDVESWACAKLWNSRVGEISREQRQDLCIAAALSWYGIAVPIQLIGAARPVLLRLGAVESADGRSLRITSSFSSKALLAGSNSPPDRPIDLGRFDTDRSARRFLITYIAACLGSLARHEEGIAALRRIRRYRSAAFEPVVAELSRTTVGGRSDLTEWARETPLNTLASGLLTLHKALAPRPAETLFAVFASRARLGEATNLALPELLDCLAVIDEFRTGDLDGDVRSALVELFDRVQEELESTRWPVQTRRRLLRLVARLSRADARDMLAGRLGPLLLRVGEVFENEDLLLPLDLFRTVERITSADKSFRSEVAAWQEVDELLLQVPVGRRTCPARQLAAGAILASAMDRTTLGREIKDDLLARLPGASLRECVFLLRMCGQYDDDLLYQVAGTLDVPKWSQTRFLSAQPVEVANALTALLRVGPDTALASTRKIGTQRVDEVLVGAQRRAIVSNADAMGCSLLLRTVARVEELTGTIDGGFAESLAAKLGMRFVEQRLNDDGRTKVILYLVEGFASAGVSLAARVRLVAAETIGNEIRSNMLSRAPELALSLASDHLFGPAFLAILADVPGVSRSRLLDCMRFASVTSAIAGYHRLAILMYPDIESEFAAWLELIWYDNPDPGLFQALSQHGNPVEALRAAAAIAETLMLAGERRPGGFVLDTYDRISGVQSWDAKLRRADDLELSEGINLLRKLDFSRASSWVEKFARHLSSRLGRLRHSPTQYLDLLTSVTRTHPDVGRTLVESAGHGANIVRLVEHVQVNADIIDQVEVLGRLTRLERITGRSLIGDDLRRLISAHLNPALTRLSHPRTLALGLDTIAHWDIEQARTLADEIVTEGRVGTRVSRQLRRDVAGTVQLLDVLVDISPALAGEVATSHTLRWLAEACVAAQLPVVVDLAGEIGWLGDVRRVAEGRIWSALERRVSNRNILHWLRVVGRCAWHAAAHGQPLEAVSLSPARATAIARLTPVDILWGYGFLAGVAQAATVDAAVENLAGMEIAGSPNEMARILATAIHTGRLDELFGTAPEAVNDAWHRAAMAGPQWIAVLTWAVWEHRLSWPDLEYDEVSRRLSAADASWKRHARQALERLGALCPSPREDSAG
jgi:hypothetical protein